MNRSDLKLLIFSFVMLILAVLFRFILLDGLGEVRLAPAPPLAGAISQSLATPQSGLGLPVAGKDYHIGNTKYFDNRVWAVAKVSLQNNNDAYLVLRANSGTYQVVLGPGTAFSFDALTQLPPDVVAYLNSQGVRGYEPLAN